MASVLSTKVKQVSQSNARQRILAAASAVFTSNGYAQASTLEIATRAKVSKRDLYALVGNKEDMLVACITERATRLKWPQDIPPPSDRGSLAMGLELLIVFGMPWLIRQQKPRTYGLGLSFCVRLPQSSYRTNGSKQKRPNGAALLNRV